MNLKQSLGLTCTALACAGLLGGCAAPKKDIAWAFEDETVRSILVIPVMSKSTQVGSDILMYSMSTFPIAERGYYTYPVETVRMVLEHEGLYEPERVHQMEPAQLAAMFDADSVLKISLNYWDAQYQLVNTTIGVEADYELYRRDGTKLWADTVTYHWRSDGGDAPSSITGLVTNMVVAAVHRASPDFRPAASAVNTHAIRLWRPGPIRQEEMGVNVEKESKSNETDKQSVEDEKTAKPEPPKDVANSK